MCEWVLRVCEHYSNPVHYPGSPIGREPRPRFQAPQELGGAQKHGWMDEWMNEWMDGLEVGLIECG